MKKPKQKKNAIEPKKINETRKSFEFFFARFALLHFVHFWFIFFATCLHEKKRIMSNWKLNLGLKKRIN